jgi:putative endonuclease
MTIPYEPVIPANAGTQLKQERMRRDINPAVYLLASQRNGTLYTGVTSNLAGRIYEHREEVFRGFTRKHRVKMLVWFEGHDTMESAILREKRIKKWERVWKLELIEAANADWRDLAEDFGFEPLE